MTPTSDPAWLAVESDAEEAAALTTRLVARRSYPGEEGAVQREVAAWFREQGLPTEFQATAGDRPNVIARVVNGDGPTLLLNGHVDTVLEARGWSGDPLRCWRDGDRLYGLGSADMKAGVAAAMLATRALARHREDWRGTVVFTSVVDEEAFSLGARALVDQGLHADYCVVTEPFHDRPQLGAVGKVLVRVEVTGKAAHGFWPWEGVNAGVEAARFVGRLSELRLGQHPRLVPSQCLLSFSSGNAQYVITVPEHASLIINRLTVPGETGATVLAEMRALAASLDSPAAFEFAIDPPYYPPWEIDQTHPLVARFARAFASELGHLPDFDYMTGVADSNYFAADLNIPTIQFGPRGANLHQSDEWVDVPSIGRTARVLLRLAGGLLG